MKIAYSILDLVIIGEDKTPLQTIENTVALAQKAEALGYKRFWLAEHHNARNIASNATPLLIGHVASKTNNIRVGSGGIMLPNHSPLIVAEEFGTLGTLYPNRIDMGLGRAPGTDQATAFAINPNRMENTHNFPLNIEKVLQYMSDNNQDAKVRTPIAEGVDTPIYLLGSSTDSAVLAAEKGFPYAFASHFAPAQLTEALRIYRNDFTPSTHAEKPYVIAGVNIIAAETEEEAERIATSMYRAVFGILTNSRNYLQPPTAMTPELRAIATHSSVQAMLQHTFVGTKESIAPQLEAFINTFDIDELMIVSNIYHLEDRIQSYTLAAEVVNSINKKRTLPTL